MEKDFILFQIGWFTKTKGNESREEQIHKMYRSLVNYFQEKKLVNKVIMHNNHDLNDDSCIMKSDLTDIGFKLYQKAEQKWLTGTDRGRDPADMSIFDKELLKLK